MIFKYDKKNLKYKNITGKLTIISLFVIILITLVVSLLLLKRVTEVKYISAETRAIILKENNEFSEENLKKYILELNIKYPHIVLAQAILESGGFKSKIFKENNNLFGMKCATRRPTTNKGEQHNHAYFDTWKDCVIDYAFFSAQYLDDIKSEKEYFDYLSQNYAEDTTYISKLKEIIEKKELKKALK